MRKMQITSKIKKIHKAIKEILKYGSIKSEDLVCIPPQIIYKETPYQFREMEKSYCLSKDEYVSFPADVWQLRLRKEITNSLLQAAAPYVEIKSVGRDFEGNYMYIGSLCLGVKRG